MKFNRNTDWSWETDIQPSGAVYYIERSETLPLKYTAWHNGNANTVLGRDLPFLSEAKLLCERDNTQDILRVSAEHHETALTRLAGK